MPDDPTPCPHPNLDDFAETDNPRDLCLACLIRIHDAVCDCDTDIRPRHTIIHRSEAFRTHALETLSLGT